MADLKMPPRVFSTKSILMQHFTVHAQHTPGVGAKAM